jgi:hypothetical protein
VGVLAVDTAGDLGAGCPGFIGGDGGELDGLLRRPVRIKTPWTSSATADAARYAGR